MYRGYYRFRVSSIFFLDPFLKINQKLVTLHKNERLIDASDHDACVLRPAARTTGHRTMAGNASVKNSAGHR